MNFVQKVHEYLQPQSETELQAGLQQGVQRVQRPARSHRPHHAAVPGAGVSAQTASSRLTEIQGKGWSSEVQVFIYCYSQFKLHILMTFYTLS